MFNFFVSKENRYDGFYLISDPDRNHIVNVLRMRCGDRFLVSCDGKSDLCELSFIDEGSVKATVLEENYNGTELPAKIHLFQGLPKADKMELIIQKAVELGVYSITPVEMHNCVVRLEDKKKKSKLARWQAISEAAAKQSKRNIVPEICDVIPFRQAIELSEKLDLFLVPYENKNGMAATVKALSKIKSGMSIGILIGPEGGFQEKEIELAISKGCECISLGKRILRTETAAITAVGMCMLHIEMNTEEN